MARVLPSVLHHDRYARLDEGGVVRVSRHRFWIGEIIKTQMQCPPSWDPHPIGLGRLPVREEERHRHFSDLRPSACRPNRARPQTAGPPLPRQARSDRRHSKGLKRTIATRAPDLSAILAAGGRRAEIYRALDAFRRRYADLIRARYPRIPRRVSGYENLDELLPEKGFNVARALVGTESTCVTILRA